MDRPSITSWRVGYVAEAASLGTGEGIADCQRGDGSSAAVPFSNLSIGELEKPAGLI